MLVLFLCQGVDFTVYYIRGLRFELDGMVPWSFWWKVLRSFLTKDLGMLLILCWYFYLRCILFHLSHEICQYGIDCTFPSENVDNFLFHFVSYHPSYMCVFLCWFCFSSYPPD